MAGCQKWEFRFADVTEDCEVLSTPKDEVLGVSIYPNPASDKLYFQGLMAEIQGVEIYSLQGKLIRSYTINISEIDVSQLSSGIYFIKVLTSDGRKTVQRFIRK